MLRAGHALPVACLRARNLRPRIGAALAVIALGVVSTTLTSAYASGATGLRGGEISGYAVSGLRFDLGTAGGITAVRFRLSPVNAHAARIQLAPNGRWLACVVRGGAVACAVPAGLDPGALDQLAVAAF